MNKSNKNWLAAGLAMVGGYLLLKKPQSATTGGASTTTALSNRSINGLGSLAMTANVGEILTAARRIMGELGRSVEQASRLTGVPRWLILSIAAYEIRLFPFSKVNPAVGATGVMQITPITGVDALYFADKYHLLNGEATAILQRFVGPKNWPVLLKAARDRSAAGAKFLKEPLKQPEFNILLGSMILKAGLIQHANTDGSPNLAKVVLQYNQGFSFGRKLAAPGLLNASDELIEARAPSTEGRLYVANMMATGGVIATMQSQIQNQLL